MISVLRPGAVLDSCISITLENPISLRSFICAIMSRFLGFRVFRGLGFRGLGFRGLGFKVF